MEQTLVPDAMMTLTDIGLGYFYSAALRAVAELGIADLLADGPKSARELADATSTSQPHLHRVLRALAGCGLFAQDADGRFQLTTAASLLRIAAGQRRAPATSGRADAIPAEHPRSGPA